MSRVLLMSVAAAGLLAGTAMAQTSPMAMPPAAVATPSPVVTATPSKPVTRVAVNRRMRSGEKSTPEDGMAPPTEAYRGGAGSPLSTQATNNAPSRPEAMGSRLPEPGSNSGSPEALLASAQRDLNAGRTGAAQEALERAQTRILSRTTDPSLSGQPDQASMSMHIAAARRALGSRNIGMARAEIQAAMSAPMPSTGPAVTTTIIPQDPVVLVPRSY